MIKVDFVKKKVTCLNNASNAHKYLPSFPPLLRQRANFSAIVYIAVRIHVMFNYMNQNIRF